MADIKISELASTTAPNDTDVLVGVNGGVTRKFALSRLKEFFKSAFDSVYASLRHEHSQLSNGNYTASLPELTKNDTIALRSDVATPDAKNTTYDNEASKLQAENVQDAIDELKKTMPTVPTLAKVATSGKYEDLTGTPTLSKVATSGKYADLSGTPNLSEEFAKYLKEHGDAEYIWDSAEKVLSLPVSIREEDGKMYVDFQDWVQTFFAGGPHWFAFRPYKPIAVATTADTFDEINKQVTNQYPFSHQNYWKLLYRVQFIEKQLGITVDWTNEEGRGTKITNAKTANLLPSEANRIDIFNTDHEDEPLIDDEGIADMPVTDLLGASEIVIKEEETDEE